MCRNLKSIGPYIKPVITTKNNADKYKNMPLIA